MRLSAYQILDATYYPFLLALSMFGILVAECAVILTLLGNYSPNVSVIMTIRVWALWGRRRDIGTLLLIVGVGGAIASLVTYTLFAQPHRCEHEHHNYSCRNSLLMTSVLDIMTPIIPGCFSIAMGSTNSWSYIPIVINQTRKCLV